MTGSDIRLGRLFQQASGRSFIIALDHGLTLGVPEGTEDIHLALYRSISALPDGMLLSPSMARSSTGHFASREAPALIVRTAFILFHPYMDDLGEQYRVLILPTEAAALGADAITLF